MNDPEMASKFGLFDKLVQVCIVIKVMILHQLTHDTDLLKRKPICVRDKEIAVGSILAYFLAHLVYQLKSLVQSYFVRRASCIAVVVVALMLTSVHTSPSHRFEHRNFIFTYVLNMYANQIFRDFG